MDTTPRVAVVVPTYNERDAISEVVMRIFSNKIPNLTALIVDDNSPDGTGAIADELAKKYPLTVLRRRQKEGLGKAYAHAFTELLTRSPEKRPDYVFQIDADLSHNPEDISRFLEKIETCDVVLGSRYVRGGGIEHWDRIRQFISKFGNMYASITLGMPYRDLTSGYKCFRREVLETINISAVSSAGYNFQIETTYYAHKKGFKICEIPIIFTERKFGVSKFNLWIIIESFITVLLLRIKR